EEGYPAYLGSRLAAFYERAGRVETLGGDNGSVTLIGAVSPPGGDFSEPVTNHTKEIIQTFWALSKELADTRHYPAISWSESFSSAVEEASHWWHKHIDPEWAQRRAQALTLLAQAEELSRIINLVGPEALSPEQRWSVEMAGVLREGLLQQSALDEVDSYCMPAKQFLLLDLLQRVYDQGRELIREGVPISALTELPLMAELRRMKSQFDNQQLEQLRSLGEEFRMQLDKLRETYREHSR
ncbi:MAG TPA: V-type ATP synthase subunit A, partial [Chromatiaceae bacterium]|nr:V-type ATP synthase subunit A [Chromatiaceae bacterium]